MCLLHITLCYQCSLYFKWSGSHSVVSSTLWPCGLYSPWNSPDHNTGAGSLSLLQGIFPTQELNPGLPHCRQILYQLNCQGSLELEFSAKRRWSVSHPQLTLRPFDQIPVSRTGGLEKGGRIGRVKQRKERGKGRESNKVSSSLPGRGSLASCPRQEEIRDKRVPVAAAGSGPSAGKLFPEYPKWSGCQSQWRKVPARVGIFCRKRDPFQGLKLGSCLTLRNELSEETHVLTK